MIESFVLSTSSKTQLKQQNGFFPLRNGLQIPSERGEGAGVSRKCIILHSVLFGSDARARLGVLKNSSDSFSNLHDGETCDTNSTHRSQAFATHHKPVGQSLEKKFAQVLEVL